MKSLMPEPYGVGRRRNMAKRNYVLDHYKDIDYRTITTKNREEAKGIEKKLKAKNIHIFNT